MRAWFLRVGAASAVLVVAFLVAPLASIAWNTGAAGDLVMPLTRPAYSGWPLVLLTPTVLALAVLAREWWRPVAVGAACGAVPFAIALSERPDMAVATPSVLAALTVAIWLASDHTGVSATGRRAARVLAGSLLVAACRRCVSAGGGRLLGVLVRLRTIVDRARAAGGRRDRLLHVARVGAPVPLARLVGICSRDTPILTVISAGPLPLELRRRRGPDLPLAPRHRSPGRANGPPGLSRAGARSRACACGTHLRAVVRDSRPDERGERGSIDLTVLREVDRA